MTITAIDQQPQLLQPAYNHNMYLATSSGTAQANFRYIFDVYDSAGSTLLARVKLPARPSDNKGLFDAKRVIENYVSYDLPTANETAGFFKNSNSFYKYTVKVGEEYALTSSGAVSQYYAQQTISGKYVWNAALEWLEFIDYLYTDYLLTIGVSGGNFLTNAPSTQSIETNQNAWLSMITFTSGSVSTANIKRYNSAGGQIVGELNLSNSNDPINEDSDRFLRVAVGPANIEAHTAGWLTGVSYYTVQILDSGTNAVSDLIRYNIVDNCRFTTVRLHWLNKLGGFDSYNFTLKSRESLAITKQQYKRRYGTDTGNWSYSSHERGDVVFDSQSKQSFRIQSDFLTEAESEWLEDLLTSPEVYRELDSETLIGIQIKADSYEKKKKVNERLFTLSLEFEYSFEKIKQRG